MTTRPPHAASCVAPALAAICASLQAVGCTGSYVASVPLTISDPTMSARNATDALFLSQGETFVLELYEADEETGLPLTPQDSQDGVDGLSARGLGGLFVPLVLDVDSLRVSEVVSEDDRIVFETEWDAVVNGIPAACTSSGARVLVSDAGGVNIEFDSFYCNWIGIGNVVTDMSLSIDRINLETASFTGYYKLTFFGTGNATGSGYYFASVRPVPAGERDAVSVAQ
ncbi:MAG: hypothetical protein AAGI30_08625 [Planctomycetota bacterium]